MTTINHLNSSFSTTGRAYQALASDSITLTETGYLISTANDALVLDGAGQTYNLVVSGTIASYATSYAGVYMGGANNLSITVNYGGNIYGEGAGLYLWGPASISNYGSIQSGGSGYAAICFEETSGDYTITNFGLIAAGYSDAIRMAGAGTHTIINSGTISAYPGRAAILSTNAAGSDIITNTGTLNGNVDLGGGTDILDSANGHILGGTVRLGAGLDTFYGSVDDDTAYGGTEHDALYGNQGGDMLYGDAGADLLDGGAGNDTLSGGADGDSYFVDAADTIIEGASGGGADVVLARTSFTLAAGDHIEFLETASAAGTQAINLTGNGLLAQYVSGNAGNNQLDGGADSFGDMLIGYAGNDTFIVRSSNDEVVDGAGQGTADRVKAAINYTLGAGDQIETLEALNPTSATALVLNGNEFGQSIWGSAGANTLRGFAGNDKLGGGLGNDTLTGGLNNDTFVFNTALNSATNRDSITDFSAPNDVIHLENSAAGTFRALGLGTLSAAAFKANASGLATDLDDRIIYNTSTGLLTYDSNGSAAGGAVQFAVLTTKPAITNADFFVI